MVATVVYILQSLVVDSPFERLDVFVRPSDPEDHVQVRTIDLKPMKASVFVEFIQFRKIGVETVVLNQGQWLRMKTVVG